MAGVESTGTIDADMCVIGAGAAGIAMALEFAGSSTSVVLLESGGATAEPHGRPPYQVLPGRHLALVEDDTRQWYFGGNTNNWAGNCRPLDDVDFTPRDWVPYSGWPMSRDDLTPYYERAQSTSGLGDYRWYDVDACRPHLQHPPFDGDPGTLATRMMQVCPVLSFAELHRDRLEAAENIRVLLHATALRLETDPGGERVRAVEFADAEGQRARVTAKVFVLAAGGVENARVLLSSNDVRAEGLGNANDLVGRFFMEHWHFVIPLGDWRASTDLALYDFDSHAPDGLQGTGFETVGDAAVWAQLVLTEELLYERRLPGLSMWFLRLPQSTPGMVALARMAASLRGRAMLDPLTDLRLVLTDPGEVPRHVLRRLRERGRARSEGWVLNAQIEQEPDPDNRVRLSTRTDAFGRLEPALDLSIRPEVRRRHLESVKIAAAALGLDGARTSRQVELLLGAGRFGFYFHHMGTTRMASDPARGVVDENCRVHGVDNLFVAGSSVFPTGGTAAPTLTIVALALRLADHIRLGSW